ncbi:hypothetical protein ABS648_05255 [Pseudomonas solani]|uniref:Uncharacterized protein n=1 Tax=Pseudomonas solani TaxID=2731552 RepID=A0AAU7Y607_9PSED
MPETTSDFKKWTTTGLSIAAGLFILDKGGDAIVANYFTKEVTDGIGSSAISFLGASSVPNWLAILLAIGAAVTGALLWWKVVKKSTSTAVADSKAALELAQVKNHELESCLAARELQLENMAETARQNASEREQLVQEAGNLQRQILEATESRKAAEHTEAQLEDTKRFLAEEMVKGSWLQAKLESVQKQREEVEALLEQAKLEVQKQKSLAADMYAEFNSRLHEMDVLMSQKESDAKATISDLQLRVKTYSQDEKLLNAIIDHARTDLDKAKATIETLKDQVKELQEPAAADEATLDKDLKQTLRALAVAEAKSVRATVHVTRDITQRGVVETRVFLDRLTARGLAKQVAGTAGIRWMLTPQGRDVALRIGGPY